jgi:hypothetical protein
MTAASSSPTTSTMTGVITGQAVSAETGQTVAFIATPVG